MFSSLLGLYSRMELLDNTETLKFKLLSNCQIIFQSDYTILYPPRKLSWWRIHLQCRRPSFNSWVGKIHWRRDRLPTPVFLGFLCGSAGKESACNAEDLGSIPGLGRAPGEGKGYPLQYSGLENSMDCIVHGVTKSWTQLSDFHFQESYEDSNFSTSLSNGQNFSLLENYRAVVLKAVNFLSCCCNCLGDLGQEPLSPGTSVFSSTEWRDWSRWPWSPPVLCIYSLSPMMGDTLTSGETDTVKQVAWSWLHNCVSDFALIQFALCLNNLRLWLSCLPQKNQINSQNLLTLLGRKQKCLIR